MKQFSKKYVAIALNVERYAQELKEKAIAGHIESVW